MKLDPTIWTAFRQLCLTCVALLFGQFSLPSAAAQDGVWLTDPARAVEIAQRDRRDMLLLFTGSDWCPPCQKLETETLSRPEFLKPAEADWVLVKFDFLRNQPLDPAVEAANEEWSQKFGVAAFPTIVLLDCEQRPIGFAGYLEGGPTAMLERLRDVRERRAQRDLALQEAAKAQGIDVAVHLDHALAALDEEVAKVWYTDLIEKIVELDADNQLGLREKWHGEQDKAARQLIRADIEAVARLDRPERAVTFIDEVLGAVEFPAAEKFEVLRIKLGLLQQQGHAAAAQTLLDEMLAMPEIGADTRENLIVRKALQYHASGEPAKALGFLDEIIKTHGSLPYVKLTQAQLRAAGGDRAGAIRLLEETISEAADRPDALIELVATLAELRCQDGDEEKALNGLEAFAADEQAPVDLRAEALLQAAMIMRAAGRIRPATLTENRAVSLADTPELTRELQRVVDAMRKSASAPASGDDSPR